MPAYEKLNLATHGEMAGGIEAGCAKVAEANTCEPFGASQAFRMALAEYESVTRQVDILESLSEVAWHERTVELRSTIGPPVLGDHWIGIQFNGIDLWRVVRRQINRLQKRRRYLRPLLSEANALAASMFPGQKVTLTLPRTLKEKQRGKRAK